MCFASNVGRVFCQMEKGQLPIQSRGNSGIATIVVPKQMRPANILIDPSKLENTHRALHQRTGVAGVAQSLHETLASRAGATGDPELQNAIENLLHATGTDAGGRSRHSFSRFVTAYCCGYVCWSTQSRIFVATQTNNNQSNSPSTSRTSVSKTTILSASVSACFSWAVVFSRSADHD